MASHVYFDFFGTLVDYNPSVLPSAANAPHAFALRSGIDVTPSRASELWQAAWQELDSRAHHSGRECSIQEIANRYQELLGSPRVAVPDIDRLVAEYLAAWTAAIRPAPFVRECLADLGRDHQLSVVSNTHSAALVPGLLRQFGIAAHFAGVFTSVEIGWRKPRPEIFEAVLARDGIRAEDAVFVGDNWEADIVGPTCVGMRAFYVGSPEKSREPVTLANLPALVRTGTEVVAPSHMTS